MTRKIFTLVNLVLITAFVLADYGSSVTSTLVTVASAHQADATVMGAITSILGEILGEPILTFS